MDFRAPGEDSTGTKRQQDTPGLPTLTSAETISPLPIQQDLKEQNAALMTGNKRKGKSPEPSTRKRPKSSKLGKREVQLRTTKLSEQLGNLFNTKPRDTDPSVNGSAHTDDDHKRDQKQVEGAVAVFGSKIKQQGYEENFPNKLYQVEGMRVPLRDYQVVGAAFMLRQERARNDCRGGIIADEMGIGKTVQMIACIVSNKPSKAAQSAGQKSTLIIVPNQGLMKQWVGELRSKATIDAARDVVVYSGAGKVPADALKGVSFIMVTYSQIEREFRLHCSKKEHEIGPLFEVNYYRIILDEGDTIRNFKGNTTKACIALNATHRWVLSGTPLRNSLQDCLPYFEFLRIDIDEEAKEFVAKWGMPKTTDKRDKALQILAHRMIRREVGQMFMERGVCTLPSTHFDDRFVSLTLAEKIIYKNLQEVMLRREAEARNSKNKDSPAMKMNYRLRCLRLRQAAEHAHLLESSFRDYFKPDEMEEMISELEECWHSKPGSKITSEDSLQTKASSLQERNPSLDRISTDVLSHLKKLVLSDDDNRCPRCSATTELRELECGHCICRDCYEKRRNKVMEKGKGEVKCPKCGKTVARIKKFGGKPGKNSVPSEPLVKLEREVYKAPDGRRTVVAPGSRKNERSFGDDYNGVKPQISSDSYRWLEECEEAEKVTPSTKMVAALSIVQESQANAPEDKIIIFTEWRPSSRVLGCMLNEASIPFVYYNGAISVTARERSYHTFKCIPEVKVMIASMSAGNLGLNLTEANLVINMSPWWNYAAESQAFGRVKRHGQTKMTRFVRLFAMEVIDQRIYNLQLQKLEDIKEAIVEGRKPKPLTLKEHLYLVGDREDVEEEEPSDEPKIKEEDDAQIGSPGDPICV